MSESTYKNFFEWIEKKHPYADEHSSEIALDAWDAAVNGFPIYSWQPIETAPKDGTELLVWDGKYAWVAYYDFDCWTNGETNVKPTHWQPLPEPPIKLNSMEEK